MNLQKTLTIVFTALFLNNVYAAAPEVAACNQALEKGDVAGALAQASKALSNNKNDNDALICQGRTQASKYDFDAALASFKSAEAHSSDAFNKTLASLLISNTYKALKQTDLAIASFKQTIINAKEAKNATFEHMSHNAIGNIYAEKNEWEDALDEYMQATKLASNDNERGDSFEKVALMHHKMEQHDLALEYQLKAYLMHDTVGTLDQYAHSSVELGRYYALTKNYTSAERVLNKIIKFAKEQGGAFYEAQGSYVLAEVKAATGDKPAAKALVEHAKSIAKSTNDKALEDEINSETQGLF